MSEVIEIVAYNPDWPRMFEGENGSEWSSFHLGTGVLLSRVASLWQAAQLSIEEQIATKNHRQHNAHSFTLSMDKNADFEPYGICFEPRLSSNHTSASYLNQM